MSSLNIFLILWLTIAGRLINIMVQQRSADMNNQPAYIALIAVIETVASNGEIFQSKLISNGRASDGITEYSTDAERVWLEIRAAVAHHQACEIAQDACMEWARERHAEENRVMSLDASDIMAAHAADMLDVWLMYAAALFYIGGLAPWSIRALEGEGT